MMAQRAAPGGGIGPVGAVWTHVSELPDRGQLLLMLRYYGNMTQIGERLGISQTHVSRLPSHALGVPAGLRPPERG